MSANNRPRDGRKYTEYSKPMVAAESTSKLEKEIAVEPKGKPEVIPEGKTEVKPETNIPKIDPYLVRVSVAALNVRKGPGINFDVVGCIRDRGVYTITKETDQRWGKLKDRNGWINLDYTSKI